MSDSSTLGWGKAKDTGVEMWDAQPTLSSFPVSWKQKAKLLFYPKKFFLYRAIAEALKEHEQRGETRSFRVLDVGCGTGAALIDLHALFGSKVVLVGVDVIRLQIDIAKQKLQSYGVQADVVWYEGDTLPFSSDSFDAVYTSDVFGHVAHPEQWMNEIGRVLCSGGTLAMFTESKPGKHALMRRYLLSRGVNTDPHAEFHISLFPKEKIRESVEKSGVNISFFSAGPAFSFFLYPDEAYPALQASHGVPVCRAVNAILATLKKKMAPFSLALVEFMTTVSFATIGQFLETQGYIVLGKKR